MCHSIAFKEKTSFLTKPSLMKIQEVGIMGKSDRIKTVASGVPSVLRPCHPCGSVVFDPHGWQGRGTDGRSPESLSGEPLRSHGRVRFMTRIICLDDVSPRNFASSMSMRQRRFPRQESWRLDRCVHLLGDMCESQHSAFCGVPEMRQDFAGGSCFGFFDSQHEYRGEQSQHDADREQHMEVRDANRQK